MGARTPGVLGANDQLPGLMDSVGPFDERRVPHVFAKNDHDLYYMQGI